MRRARRSARVLGALVALAATGGAWWAMQRHVTAPPRPGAQALTAASGADAQAAPSPDPSTASSQSRAAAPRPAEASDVVRTDHDMDLDDELCFEEVEPQEVVVRPGVVEGLSDAPFQGPQSNTLLGTGPGAGGAFAGRGGMRARHGGAAAAGGRAGGGSEPGAVGTESYADVGENGFLSVESQPLSTFSIDVDSASYANVRRMLRAGHLPPPAAVRVEELVNYFTYAYAAPTDGRPFAVHVEATACPWNVEHRLVRIGVKAREVARHARPASNLVFLLDVSGSMDQPHKLPLVKASMRMLLDELSERDHVAIVTYAGESSVALEPTTCEKKIVIADAIDRLAAGGSTNGASGIVSAYDLAARHFVPGGVNRVVLCTDGDWNVGVTSRDDLWNLIVERARSGVFLSVLGFGMGNLKDDMLEQLADRGNGAYGYIDSTREAHRVLVEQAGGTLVTVAKDVKLQVEWNPALVAGYRLVGYENRRLADRDFKDDTKDAGELGAGHTVTALYEVVPVGGLLPIAAVGGEVDPLKYQRPPEPAGVPTGSRELLTVKARWKGPEAQASTSLEVAFTDEGLGYPAASPDLKFSAAVAAFALLLRDSPQKGSAGYDGVLELAGEALGSDPGGYRREFLELVTRARALTNP